MQDPHKKSMPTQTNQSSERLLNIVEAMAQAQEPLRLQDVARLCSTNSATALRFITALQRKNYVAQEPDTGRYYLTFKFCAIGHSISSYTSIRTIAGPFLRSVAQLFGESCNLAIQQDMSIMYIETANSAHQTLLSTQRIGNVAPMHCTGIGKLFLTDYTCSDLDQLIAVKRLPRFTQRTITTKQTLLAELDTIRQQGYAYDNEECEVGVRCISAPVRDYTGKIVAGISVSGPAVRMTDAHISQNLAFLLDTAQQVSLRMGWQSTTSFQ